MDYTTLQALRAFSGQFTDRDDKLSAAMISAASRAIEGHCGRRFGSDAETVHTFTRRTTAGSVRFVDPFDGALLLLDDDLAEAPSAISGSPTVSYLPSSAPYWGIINETESWVSPISVTGHWAYSVAPPPDVEQVCLGLAKWLFEMRQTTRQDAVVVTDQGAVLMPASLPSWAIAILAPYRTIRFAR